MFKISGGQDKQGFPMKQGVLTNGRVFLLMKPGALPLQAQQLPICHQAASANCAAGSARHPACNLALAYMQSLIRVPMSVQETHASGALVAARVSAAGRQCAAASSAPTCRC